jgi:hypothetical protein
MAPILFSIGIPLGQTDLIWFFVEEKLFRNADYDRIKGKKSSVISITIKILIEAEKKKLTKIFHA